MLDINSALQQMVRHTLGSNSLLMQLVNHPAFHLRDFASEATINLPQRILVYSNSDTEAVMRTIQGYAQRIATGIGQFAVKLEMPIMGELEFLQYFGLFIGVMLKAIIASLFLLSTLMLDSTLTLSVDRQRTDLAVLKVIGASRTHVASHVLAGAVRQVVYANLLAYPFLYAAFAVMEPAVQQITGSRMAVGFSIEACGAGVVIGLLVPLVSSISPIRSIISNDLAESLGQSKPNYS
jgi:ABC-type antimicrobial peptide transport system permease subunit